MFLAEWMGVGVANEFGESYVRWQAGYSLSFVGRGVLCFYRLCLPVTYVVMCEPFFGGDCGSRVLIEFRLYY